MTRLAKQIVYGTIYLVFWALVFGWVYYAFFRPGPSCFDEKQNQDEGGIDCGGPCELACLPVNLKPLAVVDRVRLFYPDEANITAIVAVQNSNLEYGVRSFEYELTFYDGKETKLRTVSGKSFMYAGEVKYIVFPNLSLTRTSVARADFALRNADWISLEKFQKPKLSVQDQVRRIEGSQVVVEGRAVNNDSISFSKIQVVGIFQGRLGQVVGASFTELNNLLPNETREFRLIHPAQAALSDASAITTRVFLYAARP